MTKYAQHVSRKATPQSEKAHPKQEQNNAEGFAFVIDDWARLDRFLILGADGGTYYVGEKKLTKDNATCIERCLNADGIKTVNRIVEISDSGRAPKNDPAIFALALAAAHEKPEVRKAALDALPKVCRIGTHLFHFAASVEQLRGWGRSLRKAIGAWYTNRKPEQLAYQVVKYQQRDKWAHRDLLRLAHVATDDATKQAIFRWVVAGADALGERDVKRKVNGKKEEREAKYGSVSEALPAFISAFEELKACKDEKRLIQLIGEHRFTHEMIPTEFKNSADVWEALLAHMPMTAMVRSLAKMSQVGLLKPLSAASKTVCEKLVDKDMLKKARVHPIALLSALKVYEQGHGVRGSLKWEAVPQIVDALDEAFYLAFDTIEPTGKNILLALDVSGSMDGGTIAGVPGLTPRLAAAAMAMVIARSEKNWHCIGFSSGASGEWRHGNGRSQWSGMGYHAGITSLTISPKQRLDAVVKTMQKVPMGGTDCALPMLYASAKKLEVDAFVTLTDNETWAGDIHPHQALEKYRRETGRASKMVVIGMTATEFSIANKDDAGSLDVVGMDTAAPQVIADFIRGERELTPVEGAGYRDAALAETETE